MTLTCARFYHSAIFASIRPDPKSPGETHFEALCMLEYDGNIKGYCCRGCLSKHSSAAFSFEELKKQATERYCLRTKLCLRVGRFQEFSFADMQKSLGVSKEKKVQRVRLLDGLAKLYFCPVITIEDTFYLYPWLQSVFEWEFVALCCKLNFPFCPHMRMGDLKILQLYPASRRSSDAKPLSCKHCETKVTFTRGVAGDSRWAVFQTRRSIGRLFSPLDPTWLAQTFASKDPSLDDFCEASASWLEAYWQRQRTYASPLEKFDHPDPDADRLFTLPTLPKTRSSRVARLRTQAGLITTLPIPKKAYKACKLPKGKMAGS